MDPHRLTGPAASDADDADDWGNAHKTSPSRAARSPRVLCFLPRFGFPFEERLEFL